jgi:hypothetical protein
MQRGAPGWGKMRFRRLLLRGLRRLIFSAASNGNAGWKTPMPG